MKLFFKKTGEGRPLIILHGLFGLSDNWATVSKSFAGKGFACYLVDQRNHGRSGHSMEFTYELMASDIEELMNDEHLAKADIIGHSMGGKSAMFFAEAFPEKVGKMIIVDMAPRYYPPHHQVILAALKSFDPEKLSSRKEAEEQLRLAIRDESTVQFLLKNLYWTEQSSGSRLGWRFGLHEIDAGMENIGKEFAPGREQETEILFIKGEKSGYINDDDEISIKAIFPKASFAVIKDSGHWVHAEKPEEFIQVCLEFLGK